GVSENQHTVGLPLVDDALELLEERSKLAPGGCVVDRQEYVRFANAELRKKNVREISRAVLPCVQESVVRHGIELRDQPRKTNDFRPSTEHGEDTPPSARVVRGPRHRGIRADAVGGAPPRLS